MKTFFLFILLSPATNSYGLGAIIALLILAYLIYALFRPEKI
jgi:K+-transporting ATPase KdpF subunit